MHVHIIINVVAIDNDRRIVENKLLLTLYAIFIYAILVIIYLLLEPIFYSALLVVFIFPLVSYYVPR